mmetsp:Transcript_25443/g.50801  ORF Transcript_25443/g.50801 Transcript_25443/m.50801 type:complete len:203 (+) Transcript_25443:109-717(+)
MLRVERLLTKSATTTAANTIVSTPTPANPTNTDGKTPKPNSALSWPTIAPTDGANASTTSPTPPSDTMEKSWEMPSTTVHEDIMTSESPSPNIEASASPTHRPFPMPRLCLKLRAAPPPPFLREHRPNPMCLRRHPPPPSRPPELPANIPPLASPILLSSTNSTRPEQRGSKFSMESCSISRRRTWTSRFVILGFRFSSLGM